MHKPAALHRLVLVLVCGPGLSALAARPGGARVDGRVTEKLLVRQAVKPAGPGVSLQYEVCLGLFNQHYSHVTALTLALTLGAQLVLPSAKRRPSFEHYQSTSEAQEERDWSRVELSSIYDTEQLRQVWGRSRLQLREQAASTPLRVGVVVKLKQLNLTASLPALRRQVLRRVASQLSRDSSKARAVHVELPCTFFKLRALSSLQAFSAVAHGMPFAPGLHKLATAALHSLRQQLAKTSGGHNFNGLHLRVEKDAQDFTALSGGAQEVWQQYVAAMRQLNYTASSGLYVASGLLTYGAAEGFQHFVDLLLQLRLCAAVYNKEALLSSGSLRGLHPEQQAALDFLVLAQAHSFVGFGASTFSYFLREYRLRLGFPASSRLVLKTLASAGELFPAAAVSSLASLHSA